jgi:hypothetical protein|tara:strand:+ start:78863 stop:79051 length:189 start_codon:yes stop_codon:yes gene_type:complete
MDGKSREDEFVESSLQKFHLAGRLGYFADANAISLEDFECLIHSGRTERYGAHVIGREPGYA